MNKNLEIMIELQEADRRIAKASAQLEKLPREIEKYTTDLEAAREEHKGFLNRLDEAKKLRQQKEREVEDTHEAIKKANAKLHEIKTNQEYTAAMKEIENMKKAIDRLEEEQLEIMERVESSTSEEAAYKEKITEEEKKFNAIKAEKEAEINRLQGELDAEKKSRDELFAQLDNTVADQYQKIASAREGVAISRLNDRFCTECHTQVLPQIAVEVKVGEVMHTCPECSRFLYHQNSNQ